MKHLVVTLSLASLFLLQSCIEVHDRVVVAPTGHFLWSGDAHWQEDVASNAWLPEAAAKSKSFHWDYDFADSVAIARWDAAGTSGPLRQTMVCHRDSVGHTVWMRTIRIDRDIPGDDGAFAERMLGGIYEGSLWHFSAQIPGRILNVYPSPSKLDSAKGLIEWNIPLVSLVNQSQEFRVVWSQASVKTSENVPKASNFGIWTAATLGTLFAIALGGQWIRKYRRKNV